VEYRRAGFWTPRPAREASALPSPDPSLFELWEHLTDPRDREADWSSGWQLLAAAARAGRSTRTSSTAGGKRIIAHAGRHDSPAAHARADPSGLERAAEAERSQHPDLVIDARQDPVNPPPPRALPGLGDPPAPSW